MATTIIIESPESVVEGKEVAIVFTATDNETYINPDTATIAIDSNRPISSIPRTEIDRGYRFTHNAQLEYGTHTITVRAATLSGQETSDSITVTVKQKHIKVTVESPLPGSVVDSNTINFVFTVTGDKQYIDPVRVAIAPTGGYPYNRLDYTELENGYRFTHTQECADGTYTGTIYANDYDGSSIMTELPFIVDTKSTRILIESPASGTRLTGKEIEIVFTATENIYSISPGTAYVSIDSGRPVSNLTRESIPGGYRFTYNAQLEYGTHTVVAGASNSLSQEASRTVTFSNYAGIEITIETPEPEQVFPHGEEITTAFTVTDEYVPINPNTAYVYFSGAGRPYPASDLEKEYIENGYRFTLRNGITPEEGNYTFEVGASNNDGTAATAQVAFIVNNAPVIELVSPVEGETVKKKRVYVVFTATDFVPGIDPATALIYVNGHSPVGELMYEQYGSTGYRFSKTIDCIKGENTIIVSVQDKLGTTSSKTASFVVDPVVPRITDIRITPNPCEAGQEFEIIAEVEYEEV